MRPRDFLASYASRLNSVEVNYTFRALPTTEQIEGWLAATPADFRFTFKAPQRITHIKRLRDCEEPLLAFLDAIEPARKAKKLGLIFFQLPPNFKADVDRLADFLKLRALRRKGLRVSFEFRHESWFTEATYDALRSRDAALCVSESDELITPDVTTASFRSYRLRRSGGYSDAEIDRVAHRFNALVPQSETFVYLRHEELPTGPLSAARLLERMLVLQSKGAA
ncbi:DUF72 domain-containing protein [Bryocella elongata]|uniref:DUF72 domain-containing protein n=1 Tax=Bryocella elongata TaxID=863522 RepID=UPI001F1FBEDA|nr:DUF72 domain-containing protein [Bryocella elongata]